MNDLGIMLSIYSKGDSIDQIRKVCCPTDFLKPASFPQYIGERYQIYGFISRKEFGYGGKNLLV